MLSQNRAKTLQIRDLRTWEHVPCQAKVFTARIFGRNQPISRLVPSNQYANYVIDYLFLVVGAGEAATGHRGAVIDLDGTGHPLCWVWSSQTHTHDY